MLYSKESAIKYSQIRNSIQTTDSAVFGLLPEIKFQNKEVLDFGCGDGTYILKFSEIGAKRIIGIDSSPAMVELALEKTKGIRNVKVLLANGTNLPFSSNSFDFVFANFVLQHFADTIVPIREIFRVLRHGGEFLGVLPCNQLKKGSENLENTEIPVVLGSGKDSVVVHNFIKIAKTVRNDFLQAGFHIVHFEESGAPDAIIDSSYPNRNSIEINRAFIFLTEKP